MAEASSLIVASLNCDLCTLTISHLDFDICLEIIVILLLTVELLPCKSMFAHALVNIFFTIKQASVEINKSYI